MNIIIPIGGIGERFSKEGYTYPKPLINVLGKPMIFWVLATLNVDPTDKITIVYREELNAFNFRALITNHFSKLTFNFVELRSNTRGASETVLCGLNNLSKFDLDQPTMVADCDTFYGDDVVADYRRKYGNRIYYFTDNGDKPIFSYIKLDDDKVVEIKEKVRISSNANTGLYCFSSGNVLKTYCETIINNSFQEKGEFYISDVYRRMLQDGIHIEASKVQEFFCVGTPFQLQLFAANHIHMSEPQRFCFDLDNTLVSYPTIKGDYSSVEPIHQNINLAKFLKAAGHTIIIHTARRMKTHSGNVGAVVADIGLVTMETIKKFSIPCDELYFGKPYAHFYLDDLAVNPYVTPSKALGFYDTSTDARSFNQVTSLDDKIVKTSSNPSFEGEKYWYSNIPESVKDLFPKTYEISDRIVMEKINGISFSYLYVNNSLTENNLLTMLSAIKKIHNSKYPTLDFKDSLIYSNYVGKLLERFKSDYNYGVLPNIQTTFDDTLKSLQEYRMNQRGRVGVIHGDPVFTNVLLQPDNTVKFIDMRGRLGNALTIFGDENYDYAKIYQSLIGYDFILHGQPFNREYMNKMIEVFKQYIVANHGVARFNDIREITKSLLLTLLPLHNNDKCPKYYDLIGDA